MPPIPELPDLPSQGQEPWFEERNAFDLAVKEGVEGLVRGIPLLAMLEKQPLHARGHSWVIGTGTNVTGGRIHERIAARMLMGTITQGGASGRTVVDVANLALGGSDAVPIRLKRFLYLVCTINDLTLHGSKGAPARRGYNHAWRTLLALSTANAAIAANTTAFVYGPSWSTEAVSGTTSDPGGAIVNSTGGVRWRTSTPGDPALFRFDGTEVDVILTARVAGAGIATFKEGSTVLGTIDLTAGVAQEAPALFAIRDLPAGVHTVSVELTSGASLTIDSIRIPSTAPAPGVVLGEPPVVPTATDYAGYLNDLIVYKSDLAAIVADFPSFTYVDLDRPGWDPENMLVVDSNGGRKHANDYGAGWIAGEAIYDLRNVAYSGGLGTTLNQQYPDPYVAPAAQGIPYGAVDGTGSPGVILTLASPTSLNVDWARLQDPAGTTAHKIRYRIGTGAWTTIDSPGTGTTGVITGLTSNQIYEVEVAAVVGGVTQAWSKGVSKNVYTAVVDPSYTSRYRASDDAAAAGAVVASWADIGPANVPFAGTNGPTKRTAPFPYLEFDAVNDALARAMPGKPKTLFFVFRFRTVGGTKVMSAASSGSAEVVGIPSTSNTFIINNGTVLGTMPLDNGWHVGTVVFDSPNSIVALDGNPDETGSAGTNASAATWYLGRNSGSTFYDVDIAEIIQYTGVLASGPRHETAEALKAIYGTP